MRAMLILHRSEKRGDQRRWFSATLESARGVELAKTRNYPTMRAAADAAILRADLRGIAIGNLDEVVAFIGNEKPCSSCGHGMRPRLASHEPERCAICARERAA